MPITIHIQSLRDLFKGEGTPWSKQPAINWKKVEKASVAILQAGMQSGATSLMIILEKPDGETIYTEISAKEFGALASVLKGAEDRFEIEGDPRPGSN